MEKNKKLRYNRGGLVVKREKIGQRSRGDGEESIVSNGLSSNQENGEEARVKCCDKDFNLVLKDEKGELADVSDILREVSSTFGKGNFSHFPIDIGNVKAVARKLDKIVKIKPPDPKLLNYDKNNVNLKVKVRLFPKNEKKPLHKDFLPSDKFNCISMSSKSRKDPKFVPYEPYKCSVNPLIHKSKIQKLKIENKSTSESDLTENLVESTDSSSKIWNRLNQTIKDFEAERLKWEEEKKSFECKQRFLQEELRQANTHSENLEVQLATQSQVNSELKKLLVASVGEDVQSRVQSLTEDKARMSHMIRKYSEKVDKDYEERERMGIQCDVWHSKFLGATLLVDEYAKAKVGLCRQLYDAEESLAVVIDERSLCQKNFFQTYKLLQQVRNAFDPLCADGSRTLSSADLITMAVESVDQAEWVRDRLLGNIKRSVECPVTKYENLETQTPGEKMSVKVLENIKLLKERECSHAGSTIIRTPLIHRYNPNARLEHVTVNCCGHCNGEIIVV